MSWMDSWSRPSKSAQFVPPIYLTAGGEQVPYCHTCGRVISTRKSTTQAAAKTASPVKYCSERCRRNKPGQIDRRIEDAFVALLENDLASFKAKHPGEDHAVSQDQELLAQQDKVKKGNRDTRTIVWCSEVESLVFGSRFDASKTAGRKKNRAPRGIPIPQGDEWKSVDMEDGPGHTSEDESFSESDSDNEGVRLSSTTTEVDADHMYFSAGKKRPDQSKASVNGSVGGEKGWAEKIEETDEMLQKRREGQRRAEEREMVRKAARRGVAFGFVVPAEAEDLRKDSRKKGTKGKKAMAEDEVKGQAEKANERRRKCEAVITKAVIVVEPSYAKGDWGIRWREGE